MKDGALTCSGGPGTWASVHTQREFTNFRLQLEFRWFPIDPEVEKKGGNIYNSGVFFRFKPRPAGAPTIMPIAYQTQLVHTPKRANGEAGGGTGDLWITSYDHPTFKGEREGPPRQTPATGAQGAAPARAPEPGVVPSCSYPRSKFAEKPIGEWNAYDITFNGDRITVTLNGEQINSGTGAGVVPGRIGLECENTPIAFRNIRLTTFD